MVFSNPHDTSVSVLRAGITKSELPWYQIATRGFLAGAFIAMGGLFSIIVGAGLTGFHETNPGLQKLIFALVFPFGLVLVAMTGAELFTSNIMFLTPGVLSRKIPLRNLAKNWTIVWIMNFVGSLFVAGFLAYLSQLTTSDPYRAYANTIAASKSNINWGAAFLRAVGCNWLVCLSMFSAAAADDVIGRIVGIWPPVTAFVAIGFEHSVANMFFIPLGLFQDAPNTDWGKLFYQNLIPVTLGNMLGGFLFVGCVFYLLYLHNDSLHTATVKAMTKTANVRKSINTKPHSVAKQIAVPMAEVPIMPISLDAMDQHEVVINMDNPSN